MALLESQASASSGRPVTITAAHWVHGAPALPTTLGSRKGSVRVGRNVFRLVPSLMMTTTPTDHHADTRVPIPPCSTRARLIRRHVGGAHDRRIPETSSASAMTMRPSLVATQRDAQHGVVDDVCSVTELDGPAQASFADRASIDIVEADHPASQFRHHSGQTAAGLRHHLRAASHHRVEVIDRLW
jgi:hypothetical protein